MLEDLKWVTKLDHKLHGADTWSEKWRALSEIFDQKNGTHYADTVKVDSEAQAHEAYGLLRSEFAPNYSEWWRLVDSAYDQLLEAQPVG